MARTWLSDHLERPPTTQIRRQMLKYGALMVNININGYYRSVLTTWTKKLQADQSVKAK